MQEQKIIDLSTVSRATVVNNRGLTQILILNKRVYKDLKKQFDKPFSERGLKRIVTSEGDVLSINTETKVFVHGL